MSLTEDQDKDFRDVFDAYQKTKDGTDTGFLTKDNFIKAIRACGFNPSEKEVAQLRESVPDKVMLPEFMKVAEQKASEPLDTVEDLLDCFRVFDRDGQGYISVAELRNILMNLGDRFSPEEWAEVENSVGDGGMISYREFVQMILG